MLVSLISQSVPVNPGGQVQEYVAMPSVHVPPLLQGLPKQSLISITKVTKKLSKDYENLIISYVDCQTLYNILMVQVSPINP